MSGGSGRGKGKNRRFYKTPPKQTRYHLERTSASQIIEDRNLFKLVQTYHRDFYHALHYQRIEILGKLRDSLVSLTYPYGFEGWQRVIKYQYANTPLSTIGSIQMPGGRFNFGDFDESGHFKTFPALYIAVDKQTATIEALCQDVFEGGVHMNFNELALNDSSSMLNVQVHGRLKSAIDVSRPDALQKFVDLIKDFELPAHLRRLGSELDGREPILVRDTANLGRALYDPAWRRWPMQYNVPAPSQIFGELVASSGIEGIIYKSKFTKKKALAIFPQNFEASDAYVALTDAAPDTAMITRLDSSNYSK